MQIITETELLQRIDAFLERHDMAPTTFGRQATGEPQLIDSIRKGRSPSLKVASKIVDFMDRLDGEAALRAKLAAAPPPPSEVEQEFPFVKAPVNPTGASSPTCSPTSARPRSPAASASCPSSCADELALAGPAPPTVAESSLTGPAPPTVAESSLTGPSPPTVAGWAA